MYLGKHYLCLNFFKQRQLTVMTNWTFLYYKQVKAVNNTVWDGIFVDCVWTY